jgi:hypothetical protein
MATTILVVAFWNMDTGYGGPSYRRPKLRVLQAAVVTAEGYTCGSCTYPVGKLTGVAGNRP